MTNSERETIITFSDDGYTVSIYTASRVQMARYDKMCIAQPEFYAYKGQETMDGEVVAKYYTCTDKRLFYPRKKRIMSEKQRAALEQMHKIDSEG